MTYATYMVVAPMSFDTEFDTQVGEIIILYDALTF
jgi:hypothetical protein